MRWGCSGRAEVGGIGGGKAAWLGKNGVVGGEQAEPLATERVSALREGVWGWEGGVRVEG